MTTAAPPLSEASIARGHALTAQLRGIEADLAAWMDELPASSPETVDARMHGDHALAQLQQARVELGEFTQIAAGIG